MTFESIFTYFPLYLFVINIAGFLAMGIDKHKAKNNLWRIPESRLFGIAALGGSIGSILGMHAFRHKTRHASFTFGMPTILVVQIAAAAAYFL